MASSKRFFMSPADRKIINIYKSVSAEFKNDMSHIESSYDEILNNDKLNIELLKKMEEVQNKINKLLSNFTGFFMKKDEKGLIEDICQLKLDILRLKTQFMIQHVLLHNNEFDLEDYKDVAVLYNSIEELSDRALPIKWIPSDNDSNTYITLDSEYFDHQYSVLHKQYETFVEEFSIGDIWENWSYEGESSSDDSDEYGSDNSLNSFN